MPPVSHYHVAVLHIAIASLPEVLQDTINLNAHELKFADTLKVVKQLFDDDIELTPADDSSTAVSARVGTTGVPQAELILHIRRHPPPPALLI